MKNKILCMALLLIAGIVAAAENAYKSVDESGQVHYSSVPPENAVKTNRLDLPSGPTEDQIRDADQRAAIAADAAEALEKEREAANQQAQSAFSLSP